MIITTQEILSNATLTSQTISGDFVLGGTIQTGPVAFDGSLFQVLIVRVINAPTGTSPTLNFAIQQSPDQVNWTQVGAGLANLTAAGVQLTPYVAGGANPNITQAFWRAVVVVGGTNASWTGVYADLVTQLT